MLQVILRARNANQSLNYKPLFSFSVPVYPPFVLFPKFYHILHGVVYVFLENAKVQQRLLCRPCSNYMWSLNIMPYIYIYIFITCLKSSIKALLFNIEYNTINHFTTWEVSSFKCFTELLWTHINLSLCSHIYGSCSFEFIKFRPVVVSHNGATLKTNGRFAGRLKTIMEYLMNWNWVFVIRSSTR